MPLPSCLTPASSRSRGRLELFGAAMLFGLMAVSARGATGAGGFTSAQLATVRFITGIGVCLALFRLRPGTFRPVNYWMLVSRGLFGGAGALLYFVSLGHIPAGEATLLNSLHPILATLFSIAFLGERPTLHLALALGVVTLGTGLVLGGGGVQLGLGVGELAGIGSAVLGGAAVTSIRAMRSTDNAPTIFFAFTVGGLLVSLPFADGAWPAGPGVWTLALVTGLLSVGAQMLMTDAYDVLTVAEAGIWVQLTPVASFVWALALLGEPVGFWQGVGVFAAVGGVAWGASVGHRPRDARPAGTPADVKVVDDRPVPPLAQAPAPVPSRMGQAEGSEGA